MRDDSLIDALECYQHQPALLTKGMVALLTKADPALDAKAGAKCCWPVAGQHQS